MAFVGWSLAWQQPLPIRAETQETWQHHWKHQGLQHHWKHQVCSYLKNANSPPLRTIGYRTTGSQHSCMKQRRAWPEMGWLAQWNAHIHQQTAPSLTVQQWQDHWMTRSLNDKIIEQYEDQLTDDWTISRPKWNWHWLTHQCMAIQEQLVSNKFDAWLQDHRISHLIGNEIGYLASNHEAQVRESSKRQTSVSNMFLCSEIDKDGQFPWQWCSHRQISGDMLSHHFRLGKTNCSLSSLCTQSSQNQKRSKSKHEAQFSHPHFCHTKSSIASMEPFGPWRHSSNLAVSKWMNFKALNLDAKSRKPVFSN